MQIDAQVIENMLITFIIHIYDVEKEKKQLWKKHKYEKTSFHFIKIQTEIYFSKMRWLVNPNLVYLILGFMWTLNLSTLYQLQCEL